MVGIILSLAAYTVAFLLAPTIGAVASFAATLLSAPVVAFLSPQRRARAFIYGVFQAPTCALGAFVSLWFARLLFGLLRVHAGVGVVWVLGSGFAFNDLKLLKNSEGGELFYNVARAVGDLVGLVLGGIYLLP
jgi:hypothetical protein